MLLYFIILYYIILFIYICYIYYNILYIYVYIYDNKQPLSLTIVPGHIKSHVAKKDKTGSVDYCRSVAESSWSSTFPAISLHLQTFGSCLSTARIKEVASAAGTSVLMHSLESSMHE